MEDATRGKKRRREKEISCRRNGRPPEGRIHKLQEFTYPGGISKNFFSLLFDKGKQ